MDISMEKSSLPLLGFFPYQKSLSGFLFHDHQKFLGTVGLVQMHLIEHDRN